MVLRGLRGWGKGIYGEDIRVAFGYDSDGDENVALKVNSVCRMFAI